MTRKFQTLLIVSTLLAVAITSCDNREEIINEVTAEVEIQWDNYFKGFELFLADQAVDSAPDGQYYDSLKINQSKEYSFVLDSLGSVDLDISYDTTLAEIAYDTVNSKLSYKATTKPGTCAITITVTNPNGDNKDYVINMTNIPNKLPVALFEMTLLNRQNDTIDITFDASASYDPDSAYGGEIILYKYKIVNEATSESSKYKVTDQFTFSELTFDVSVMDNDSNWSKTLRQVYKKQQVGKIYVWTK
ncbi:MAG: hypothetical protein MI922_03765, partial [Bacteroidales bacterium]|nr:hypothetical protein [Bacteroidales bacterium]